MTDVVLEQLVKKENMPLDYLKKALILLAGLIVAFVAFQFAFVAYVGNIAFLIAVGALYFAWYFITSLNWEYEYIYVNGEMDVDRISAKRKRKRLVTVRISSFEEFQKFDRASFDPHAYEVKYEAMRSPRAENVYQATFHDREGKRCVLLFTPDERLLPVIEEQFERARRLGQV